MRAVCAIVVEVVTLILFYLYLIFFHHPTVSTPTIPSEKAIIAGYCHRERVVAYAYYWNQACKGMGFSDNCELRDDQVQRVDTKATLWEKTTCLGNH